MKRKFTTADFIAKARAVHGNKYDYSKVAYIKTVIPVEIICPIHGSFWQKPKSHLAGCGCPKCAHDNQFVTQEDFIKRAKAIHGDKYDYSKTHYTDSRLDVCIVCNSCGTKFWQRAHNHLRGMGCPACGHKKMTFKVSKPNEQFLLDCKEILGDMYSYDKTHYVGSKEKVCITCPKHGDFWKYPSQVYNGSGCPMCEKEHKFEENKRSFFEKANLLFGDKYSFDKSVYIDSQTKIEVVCKKHGLFWLRPNSILMGVGCPKCWEEKRGSYLLSNTEEFIEKAKKKHGDLYIYDEVKYINQRTPVTIICREHGAYEQTPHSHLAGYGCPTCRNSKGELKVRDFLIKNSITFEQQKRIKNDILFCETQNFVVDFFLPDINTIIEFNGEQHYVPIEHFGGESKFQKQHERDIVLRQYCKEHKIKLIEIPYTEFDNVETILTKELLT